MKRSTRVSLVAILKTVQVLEKRLQKLLDSETPKESTPDSQNTTTLMWNHYSECYHRRWGVDPSRSAKGMSILKSLIASHGFERSHLIVSHYFEMRDAYYIRRCHPLTVLRQDADRIAVSCETGKAITQSEAQQMDRVAGQMNLLAKIRRGDV